MGKYLKLFEQHAQYEAYIGGGGAVLPNVSYCIDNDEVHYNPVIPETRLVATFNVTDIAYPTNIIYFAGISYMSKIEVDDTEISLEVLRQSYGSYQFDTTGEHTVKYTLIDNSTMPESIFIVVDFTNIIIPSIITTIGADAFRGCSSLTSVTINATTPPTLMNSLAFDDTNDCPIYVPAQSVDTYKAASGWSSLASRIQAIQS